MSRRDEDVSFDNLATGMGEGTISRGRAIKLAGAALLGSALTVFAADKAEAVHTGCRHRDVRCVGRRRPGGRRRVFCCPRAVIQVATCRTAILRGLCVRVA